MGAEYPVEVETIAKPKAEYQSDEWAELDLPCAPAIMIGEDILVERSDVSEEKIVGAIRAQLGMPPLEPDKKGILSRLFK